MFTSFPGRRFLPNDGIRKVYRWLEILLNRSPTSTLVPELDGKSAGTPFLCNGCIRKVYRWMENSVIPKHTRSRRSPSSGWSYGVVFLPMTVYAEFTGGWKAPNQTLYFSLYSRVLISRSYLFLAG